MKKTTKTALFGTLMVLAAAACWGTVGVYIRALTAAGLSSWEIALVRMGVALVALLAYLLPFRPSALKLKKKDIWVFAASGLGSVMGANICYSQAVGVTSLAVAGTLLYTAPAFVMLISAFAFRERLTVKKVFCLLLSFAGCALVSGLLGGVEVTPYGLLMGLGAGFTYSLYSIFSRLAIERGYSGWTITFYSFAFAELGFLVFSHPEKIVTAISIDPTVLIPMLLLGFVAGFMAFVLYTLGLGFLETGRASIVASTELVFGALVGAAVFRETVNGIQALGIVLLLSSVVLLSISGKKSPSVSKTVYKEKAAEETADH